MGVLMPMLFLCFLPHTDTHEFKLDLFMLFRQVAGCNEFSSDFELKYLTFEYKVNHRPIKLMRQLMNVRRKKKVKKQTYKTTF